MKQKLNLRELNGAPISIILAIFMNENRNCSVSWLCAETGYSDKTIANGLEVLRSRQIVTETRRNRYQLVGKNVQLPLYWGETTEPADPSPASYQAELPGMTGQVEKFSRKNSGSEKFLSGKIPEMERRISALEAEVAALKSGISPKIREIPDETGENPDVNLLTTTKRNTDIEINNVVVVDSGEIPESGKNPERQEQQTENIQDYLRLMQRNGCASLYDQADFEEILAADPDPEVLEFVLPRATTKEAAKKWIGYNRSVLKNRIGIIFGFWGKALEEMTKREDIHAVCMDYHYWYWYDNEQARPELKIGVVASRILNHQDEFKAQNSDRLPYMYLE